MHDFKHWAKSTFFNIFLKVSLNAAPIGFKLFWFWPEFRVVVQSVDWNHDGHVLGDGDSADPHSLLGCSFQTCN